MATEGVSDVHYYKSTMTGAPNLYSGTGTARINAIVKACLIDGFGSEAPQGSWQVAYSKSGVIALQSTELADRPLLRIDDYGPQWAYLRAYETMSSIDSGVNPFPTIAQSANGGGVQKSDYTGTNPRPWTLFADSRSVFFFCDNANNGLWPNGFYFGDGVLYNPDDLFFCNLIAQLPSSSFALYCLDLGTASWLPRDYTGTAGTQTLSARYSHTKSGSALGSAGQTYPSPVRTKLELWPVEVWDSTSRARGLFPGLWNPIHPPITHETVVDAENTTINRKVFIQKMSVNYCCAIDLVGPWRDDGPYSISGTISELLVPGSYRVCLFRQSDMQLLKTVWSAADGSYAFTNLRNQNYVVTAYDHTDPKRSPVSKDNVVPS